MSYTYDMNCYEYLLACTEEYGEYTAAIAYNNKLSISQLVREIDGLATYFTQSGLSRGDVYTIFLPTCVQSFVAFYALNKIGVIANIVHPLTAPDVLLEIMESTGSRGILLMDILAKDYVPMLNETGCPVLVCCNSDYVRSVMRYGFRAFEMVAAKEAGGLQNAKKYVDACKCEPTEGLYDNGEDTAVYMHGGGTTGKSKTIQLSSKAINELVYKIDDYLYVHEPGEECSLIVLPMFHAFGLVVSLHVSLCKGMCCIPLARFTPKAANKIMRKNRVVYTVGVPAMFKKMREEKHFEGPHLKNIRLMLSGGDVVSEQFLQEFNSIIEKWGGTGKLYRGYGLTEVSSGCCTNRIGVCRENSIGKPLDESLIMEIWDDNHQELPPNTIGEIVISGSTAMQGYLTPQRTPDEGIYFDENGKRWILTGDMGYMDADGFFYFTSRKKQVIIISGYNVYPIDIQNAVETLDYIKESCAVQGYLDGKPIVKLYVTLNETSASQEEIYANLARFCEENLAHFSRPRLIEILDEMPRTKMAKIDFMALAERPPTRPIK